jgi:hypothetical protein
MQNVVIEKNDGDKKNCTDAAWESESVTETCFHDQELTLGGWTSFI